MHTITSFFIGLIVGWIAKIFSDCLKRQLSSDNEKLENLSKAYKASNQLDFDVISITNALRASLERSKVTPQNIFEGVWKTEKIYGLFNEFLLVVEHVLNIPKDFISTIYEIRIEINDVYTIWNMNVGNGLNINDAINEVNRMSNKITNKTFAFTTELNEWIRNEKTKINDKQIFINRLKGIIKL